MKINKKIIIIKYGTAVLMSNRGGIDETVIQTHGSIINKHNGPVLIVSSGAVGLGDSLANFDYIKDEVIRKRAKASLGNPHLSIAWDSAVKDKNVLQALVTHRGLQNVAVQGDIRRIVGEIYKNGNSSVIQFNENDFVSDAELREIRGGEFGDNDKTASLIAELCFGLFDEVELIVNTSSDGVMDEKKEILKNISAKDLSDDKIDLICGEKTSSGTGGMKNKLKILRGLVIKYPQISIWIVNGKKTEQIETVLKGGHAGTKMVFKI